MINSEDQFAERDPVEIVLRNPEVFGETCVVFWKESDFNTRGKNAVLWIVNDCAAFVKLGFSAVDSEIIRN